MTNKIKGTYISIDPSSITTQKSKVRQLVDIIQADIHSAGSANTRKKYEVFASGGTGLTTVKSGLFQTIYDQDHTLQTSNPIFDMTVGIYEGSTTYTTTAPKSGTDSSGKLLFNNTTLMMREKGHIYKQYAQNILGDPDGVFKVPFDADLSSTPTAQVDHAIFINIGRLFTRDNIKKESFAMRFYQKAAVVKIDANHVGAPTSTEVDENISGSLPSVTGANYMKLYDTGASSSKKVSPIAGEFGTLKLDDGSDTPVGIIYYDLGIVMFDAEKLFTGNQILRGLVSDVTSTQDNQTLPAVNNDANTAQIHPPFGYNSGNKVFSGSFIPNFWISGSIDDIVDHVCDTRFGAANLTAMAFKNETTINSSLIFCRAAPSQLNFSTNPTYTDSSGKLRVITEDDDKVFSYITTVGLHGGADNSLLAVAKLSRPVEKNEETDLSIRIRLDY